MKGDCCVNLSSTGSNWVGVVVGMIEDAARPGDLDADAFNTAAGHAVMAMIISQDIRPGRSIAW